MRPNTRLMSVALLVLLGCGGASPNTGSANVTVSWREANLEHGISVEMPGAPRRSVLASEEIAYAAGIDPSFEATVAIERVIFYRSPETVLEKLAEGIANLMAQRVSGTASAISSASFQSVQGSAVPAREFTVVGSSRGTAITLHTMLALHGSVLLKTVWTTPTEHTDSHQELRRRFESSIRLGAAPSFFQQAVASFRPPEAREISVSLPGTPARTTERLENDVELVKYVSEAHRGIAYALTFFRRTPGDIERAVRSVCEERHAAAHRVGTANGCRFRELSPYDSFEGPTELAVDSIVVAAGDMMVELDFVYPAAVTEEAREASEAFLRSLVYEPATPTSL